MALPHSFTNLENFRLAFERIRRGRNKEYKRLLRHLLPSYQLTGDEDLKDAVAQIKRGAYEPQPPLLVHVPKESGILRPLALLSMRDLIVYQAIVNQVAVAFGKEQERHAFKRSFGAIWAGRDSPFFYRSWKVCYQSYNRAIADAFEQGRDFVADFDLVSFYELIDHSLLSDILKANVRSNELLDLLFKCLKVWRTSDTGESIKHGIPQGPEPSAFLAECLLFRFDTIKFKDVTYLRYVDDIKLMAESEAPLRRALMQLDVESKRLGLVPQAQKMGLRRVASLTDIQKTIPSKIVSAISQRPKSSSTQQRLLRLFKSSQQKSQGAWQIIDPTKFKFALGRLKPRREVLRRIGLLLPRRPEISGLFASYLKQFPNDREAAEILRSALESDPVYDAVAGDYIEALDTCEPSEKNLAYQRVVNTILKRSVEKSILIKVPIPIFKGRRYGAKKSVDLISRETEPVARGMAIHRLFGEGKDALYRPEQCKSLLETAIAGDDADLARYCGAVLLLNKWPWPTRGRPPIGRSANDSVKILLKALGLRRRGPRRASAIDAFFRHRQDIHIPINWRKALGDDWQAAEQKCLSYQNLQGAYPSARVMILDTFNETLIQTFSKRHPKLSGPYKKAARTNPHPDYGSWLYQPDLPSILPKGISWLRGVHANRVKADLAHAREKGGKGKGKATKPISFRTAENLMRQAQQAWAELILVWSKIS